MCHTPAAVEPLRDPYPRPKPHAQTLFWEGGGAGAHIARVLAPARLPRCRDSAAPGSRSAADSPAGSLPGCRPDHVCHAAPRSPIVLFLFVLFESRRVRETIF